MAGESQSVMLGAGMERVAAWGLPWRDNPGWRLWVWTPHFLAYDPIDDDASVVMSYVNDYVSWYDPIHGS